MRVAETSAGAATAARELVIAYGWNATCYQILNPGILYWFSPAHPAVVGYTRRGNVLLAAGEPVCEADALASVCEEFEAYAQESRCSVCYVCAEERLRLLFADSRRHAAIALGAQPSWDPRHWSGIIRRRSSLRAQLHRATNKGVFVERVNIERAGGNPELQMLLEQWLSGRRLPPLHFLVEPTVLDGVLEDRMVLLARCGAKPVAFLVASPARARRGYLVELLARSPAAPNGTSELLIDAAMRVFAEEGDRYATLGLVALAHAADSEIRENPGWLRMLMYFARAHANRFYNFRGLEQFRLKMLPDMWEPVYAISNERRFSPQSLYAMGAAFSGISPSAAIAIGVAKAAGEELARLRNRLSR